MSLDIAPVALALFLIASVTLAGFTLYANQAGRIRGVYTGIAGALLGLIFAILIAMFTGQLMMASAVGIIILGWFLAFSRVKADR